MLQYVDLWSHDTTWGGKKDSGGFGVPGYGDSVVIPGVLHHYGGTKCSS